MNEHQAVTRYIKHLADSADFKGSTLNYPCNGLIGNRFEMPNVSYTHPLPAILLLVEKQLSFSANVRTFVYSSE